MEPVLNGTALLTMEGDLAARMVHGIHSPPLGHIATMLKDLDTIADIARQTSTPVPMASLAAQLFRLAKTTRGADADALEIYKLSSSQAG